MGILSLDLHCILLFYYSGTELFLMPSWFFRELLGREWDEVSEFTWEWEYKALTMIMI